MRNYIGTAFLILLGFLTVMPVGGQNVFIYSPGEKTGLHIACKASHPIGETTANGFVDLGQLCSSDYGPWGQEKRMINPFVLRASDGTWRAVWW